MSTNIKRLLAYNDPEHGRELIAQDEIASFTQPVVILGDLSMAEQKGTTSAV